jgi:hypothetical protein
MKYEWVYLRAYAAVSEAKSNMAQYITGTNMKRIHSSMEEQAN